MDSIKDKLTPEEKREIYKNFQEWIKLILKIEDLEARYNSFIKKVSKLSPMEFAEGLHFILRQAQMGKPSFMEFLEVLKMINLSRKSFRLGFLYDTYVYAENWGYSEVVDFLTIPQKMEKIDENFFPDPNQLANEITLGERKFLAMSTDINTIEKLLFDPSPMVIKKLLQNPRLRLREVIRIAAKRPNKGEVLRVIFESKKWIVHYEVKVALVRNPYTPPEIALKILPLLREKDLIEVKNDKVLHPFIIESAERILKKKRNQSS